MTELEALAKDCIENHTHRLVDKPTKQDIYLREESIFIQGYRQSEKRIEELEAQIEEMKCCENCAWWYKLPNGQRDCVETCKNRDNWSLRR